MPRQVFISGPLFSAGERMFLEQMADALARASGLDPVTDFFLPHRDSGETERHLTARDIFQVDMGTGRGGRSRGSARRAGRRQWHLY